MDNDASLAFEKGHGYRLNLASSQAFQKLYTAIFRDSLTYQVMEDLFWGRFNGIVRRQQNIIPVMPRFGACSKGLQKF